MALHRNRKRQKSALLLDASPVRDDGVAGSNPATPTRKFNGLERLHRIYPTVIPTVSAILAATCVAFAQPLIIDGDTIIIDQTHIRIANIDAPETHNAKCDAERRLGNVAKRRIGELLASGRIEIHVGDPKDGRKKDRHGRTLATITVDGKDIGDVMIAEGIARPWTGKRQPWCVK